MNAKTQLSVAQPTLSPLAAMADRLAVNQNELHDILMQTIMPNAGKSVTQAQFIAFMAVANNYNLDPLKKEIYAFPGNGGTIQPIVSVDGWIRIIQSHPQFDGMELTENMDAQGGLISVTCTIYRKDRSKPTVITEYLSECKRGTDNWTTKPIRMLRHKAVIQCGRYAFGLGGIMDEDEYERMVEREVNPNAPALPAQQETTRADALKNKLRSRGEDAAVIEPDDPKPADTKPAPAPAPEPEEEPLPMAAETTYAAVMQAINDANSPETMQAAKELMIAFCGTGENDKFQEELGGHYRWKLSELKGK